MNKFILILILCISSIVHAQFLSKEEIIQAREEHFTHLTDTTTDVLNIEEINSFDGLEYFEFDPTFQINARFEKNIGKRFKMPTSTERLPVYRRYGYVYFDYNNESCTLEVYQNMEIRRIKEYKDYLFIPFRDETSRIETYGGGRYLDVKIPSGETIQIDFNRAYNPYCAYSHRYSCPIPPETNTLKIKVEAGEKTPPGVH